MKFHETSFEDYLLAHKKQPLHPNLVKLYKTLPKTLATFKNIILYGPPGVGKYTQMLELISRYSPSQLKYEKKISVTYNKNTYFFKISDIHYEIDLAILGCHSKLLWHDVYNQIVDIVMVKKDKVGIIVCKNFHEIHTELLECFYSYMQTIPNNKFSLYFILLTEAVSFIPDNIVNCCKRIHVARPTRLQYNKLITTLETCEGVKDIKNIKHLHAAIKTPIQPYEVICNNIYTTLIKQEDFNFTTLREQLYDILVYNLNMDECVWLIIEKLINEHKINEDALVEALVKTYDFFKNYNNNYRPIYHLEKLVINLIQIIQDIK